MGISWDDVSALAPELSTVGDDAQSALIAHANVALDVAAFGGEAAPSLKLARCYLAAHFATLGKNGGKGAITSESVGGMSRSYAAPSGSDSEMLSTSYGRAYAALVSRSLARLPVIL